MLYPFLKDTEIKFRTIVMDQVFDPFKQKSIGNYENIYIQG